ncbi:hypothetical protein V1522DRAFT_455056 [Lipomyces starkeyi]
MVAPLSLVNPSPLSLLAQMSLTTSPKIKIARLDIKILQKMLKILKKCPDSNGVIFIAKSARAANVAPCRSLVKVARRSVVQPPEPQLICLGDSVLRDRVDGCLKAGGLIWHVIPAFEILLDKLEKAKKEEVENSYRIQWQGAVNCAWDLLDKYYQRLEDCPAYYAAVALHPRYR